MELCTDHEGFQCATKAQMDLATIELETNFDDEDDNETLIEAWNEGQSCQCLQSCTSIEYEAEISQTLFDWKALMKAYALPIEKENNNYMYTQVEIFFKEAHFITSRRSELYGRTDLFANCGGLLGLFMGFSVLSITEILYFLTLRLWCILRRKNVGEQQK